MKLLTPAQRLIVAADFDPEGDRGRVWGRNEVLTFADRIHGTGVCLKMNSILRACGYGLIDEINDRGLDAFADLKLNDIPATMSIDGKFLREAKPKIVTAMCTTGHAALIALKAELPDTEVLGVTVLTSLEDKDTDAMFTCSTEEGVMRFAEVAEKANIDGLVSSPVEVEMLRAGFGGLFSLNTPAIRPAWSQVKNDDQNSKRAMTPAMAIKAGADRIVVGRPILQHPDPALAIRMTIEEIASAVA